VLAQPENRRAIWRFVAPNAFEYSGAIADNVGKDVELGVVPKYPRSVVPNLIGLLYRHGVSFSHCEEERLLLSAE
jgi:hypothetical protein